MHIYTHNTTGVERTICKLYEQHPRQRNSPSDQVVAGKNDRSSTPTHDVKYETMLYDG